MTLPFPVAKQYLSEVFVETGTYNGDGVERALQSGYKTVYSVELYPEPYELAKRRFADNPAVFLFQGSSEVMLPEILSHITCKATFWLDAHEMNAGPKCPLPLELDEIKKHHINYHTIMVDDRRELPWWGTSEAEVIRKLLEINPKYKIVFHDNLYRKEDLIVAVLD